MHATGVIWAYTDPIPWARGEHCRFGTVEECAAPASHKVEEVSDDPRHPLTAYLCCEHFGAVMGPLAQRCCLRARVI